MGRQTKSLGSYEVVSPLGNPIVKVLPLAPRLQTLEGKTICEVSTLLFRTEETFPIIRELLRKRFPTVKIIPYTDLPSAPHTRDLEKNLEALGKALIEKGCDALITGNGA